MCLRQTSASSSASSSVSLLTQNQSLSKPQSLSSVLISSGSSSTPFLSTTLCFASASSALSPSIGEHQFEWNSLRVDDRFEWKTSLSLCRLFCHRGIRLQLSSASLHSAFEYNYSTTASIGHHYSSGRRLSLMSSRDSSAAALQLHFTQSSNAVARQSPRG